MDAPQADYPDTTHQRIVTLAAPSIASLVVLLNAEIALIAALTPPQGTEPAIEGLKLAGAGAGGLWVATLEWGFADNDPTPPDRPADSMQIAGAETECSNDQDVQTALELASSPAGPTLGEALQRAINSLVSSDTTLWDVATAGCGEHRFGALALCEVTGIG